MEGGDDAYKSELSFVFMPSTQANENRLDYQVMMAEALVLQQRALRGPYLREMGIHTIEQLELLSRSHSQCTAACPALVNLNRNDRVLVRGRPHVATGNVFVCMRSGMIHLCGSHYCEDFILTEECSMICRLTGMYLDRAETLRRERQDYECLRVGGFYVNQPLPLDESGGGGMTEERYNEKLNTTLERINDAREFGSHRQVVANFAETLTAKDEESLAVAADPTNTEEAEPDGGLKPLEGKSKAKRKRGEYKKTAEKKARNQATLAREEAVDTAIQSTAMVSERPILPYTVEFLSLMRQQYGTADEQHILYLYRMHMYDTKEALMAYLARRHLLYLAMRALWILCVADRQYVAKLREQIENKMTEFRKIVHNYALYVREDQQPIDNFYCYSQFMDTVGPFLKVYYTHPDIAGINSRFMEYYIECVLRVWEAFAPFISKLEGNINFDSCKMAILDYLRAGLVVYVYFRPHSNKPCVKGNLTIPEQATATCKAITFISPHPYLVLKSQVDVYAKVKAPDKRRAASATSKQQAAAPPVKKLPPLLPSRKDFNKLLDAAIEQSESEVALHEFTLEKLYPRYTMPAGVYRK